MKVNMYCILDRGVRCYTFPFGAHNDYAAMRIFYRACHDPESMMSVKPSDFALYRIGSYDDSNATIDPERPEFLAVDDIPLSEIPDAPVLIDDGAHVQSDVDFRDGKPVPRDYSGTPQLKDVTLHD